MAYKKTDNCCRYCKHRGWGKTTTKQTKDDRAVCLKKPKTFKCQDPNERYFHAIHMLSNSCNNFERDVPNNT